ncbi:MAG: hypothetical protein Q4A65_04340 [Bacillota bacterium]|nr:hypothetical protein [Bacillota bacterium]
MDINRIIIYIMLFFVLVGAADQITDFTPLPNIMPLVEVFGIIGNVAVILADAFVLVEIIALMVSRSKEKEELYPVLLLWWSIRGLRVLLRNPPSCASPPRLAWTIGCSKAHRAFSRRRFPFGFSPCMRFQYKTKDR